MSEPFLSEIKIISWNYNPQGWAFCNGQFMPINQNQALFSLLGTTYGGNGQTTFALPDFRGRIPVHEGAGFTLGQKGGQEAHTVTMSEMPMHVHFLNASSTDGNTNQPGSHLLARSVIGPPYRNPPPNLAMNAANVTNTGGSQAHNNMMPFLTLNFIIALQGIFPSQN